MRLQKKRQRTLPGSGVQVMRFARCWLLLFGCRALRCLYFQMLSNSRSASLIFRLSLDKSNNFVPHGCELGDVCVRLLAMLMGDGVVAEPKGGDRLRLTVVSGGGRLDCCSVHDVITWMWYCGLTIDRSAGQLESCWSKASPQKRQPGHAKMSSQAHAAGTRVLRTVRAARCGQVLPASRSGFQHFFEPHLAGQHHWMGLTYVFFAGSF